MPWAVAAAVGAAVVGGAASVISANEASDAQKDAANAAISADERKLEQIRGDLAPYRDAGARALGYYEDFLGMGGTDRRDEAHDLFRSSPGYQFAMDEGIRATEGSAAARGGALSGGTLKALQARGMGLADQTSGSYLDRFLGLTSIGENAAAQTGNFTAGSAARQGGYITDAGAAEAGGYLAAGQGVNGAINNSLQLYGYGKGQGWWDAPSYTPQPFSAATTASYFPKVG